MMKNTHRVFFSLMWAAVALCFAACGGVRQETQPPTEDPNLQVRTYSLVAEAASDLAQLEAYPNLSSLDLRGSTCYDAILEYIGTHPRVSVLYDVQIGEVLCSGDAAELTLNNCDYEQLMEKLAYLPNLEALRLPATTLTAAELTGLRETYPRIAVHYTVMLLEEEISGDATELDLSHLMPEQVEEAAAALTRLPALTDIQLMNGEGQSSLGMTDVKKLMDAAPEAKVHYSFRLFGKALSTADERVEYVNTKIGDEGVSEVRQALDILPECTYFLLDRCGISNEVMAQLRDDYPDTKIVWRINYAGRKSLLTDTEVIHCVEQLEDANSRDLKYCTDVVYMDIGHSYLLSDLSFVSGMTKLKVAIVVDCRADSLEPFATCSSLQYLEIVNCNRMTDLSPLANCTELRGLNMSYTFSIDDLSPLYGLEKMERLFLGRHDLPQEQIDAVREALPECWVTDESESVAWVGFNYSVGWRLDDEHTFAEWYKEIKEVFGYTREIY